MLILDEPTEGIQPSVISEIGDAITALHGPRGLSILLVEQNVEFALRLAERFAIMDGGISTHSGLTADVDVSEFSDLLAV